jgi:hypothetical protein
MKKSNLNKLIWFITLLTVVTPAYAGFIAAAVAAVSSFFAAGAAIVASLGFVGQFILGYVAQAFLGFLGVGKPDLSNQQTATEQAQGVQLQRRGSNEQIPVVYGLRRIGSVISFATTGSDDNKYLWVCYTFCEGPISSLRKIYIDDWDLDTDKSPGYCAGLLNAGDKMLAVDWGKYSGRAQFFFSKGKYYDDPTTSTINSYILGTGNVFEGVPEKTATKPGYDNRMIHNGLVTLWARYEWKKITTQAEADANPFGGSIPVIQLELEGRTVQPLYIQSNVATLNYNTKVTSTQSAAYGTGERYSTNPAEILLDYMRNPRYGKGVSINDIHWDSWYKSAAKCYQLVPTSISGQSQPIMTFNGIVPTDATIFNNVKIILQNFRAYMPYHQGKFKLKIEDAGNETDILSGNATIQRTFTVDNIVGEVTYTGVERSSKYNQVVVTYVEPMEKYTNQTVVYPETETQRLANVAIDGGREYKQEITFPAITSRDQAAAMARLIFNKSRYQETCSLTVTSEAFNLEVGDCVHVKSKILDFVDPVNAANSIPWRIVSLRINNDHTVTLSLVRNPDYLYPYTRAGEKDYILPTYVPKGVTRSLPTQVELYPIGIIPPNFYHAPTGTANPVINPQPGTGNVTLSNNSTIVSTIKSPSLTDTIAGIAIGLQNTGDNTNVKITLTWTQPNIPYAGLKIAVTANPVNLAVGTIIEECLLSPGAGLEIKYTLAAGFAANYKFDIVLTIKYLDGTYSTASKSYQVTTPLSAGTTAAPTNNTTTTAPTTPTAPTPVTPAPQPVPAPAPPVPAPAPAPVYTPVPVVIVRDDYFTTLTANITSGQYSSIPRQFSFQVKPSTNNADLIGYNIYLRPSGQAYYTQVTDTTPGVVYTPTTTTTTTITLTGVSTPIFDCVLRAKYKDGSESTKQHRFTFDLTPASGLFPYDPWYVIQKPVENSSAFNPPLAPPGFVGSGAAVTMSVASVRTATTGMLLTINPPAAGDRSYWYGCNVRYRPVVPGTNPVFTLIQNRTTWAGAAGSGGAVYINVTIPATFNQSYEIIVTPWIYNGSTITEADNSYLGVGFVNDSTASIIYPADGNWNFNFNWRQVATSAALQQINTAFAPPVMADAVVQLSAFNSFNVDGNYVYDTLPTANNFTSTAPFVLQRYHQLTFGGTSTITNFKQVYIYRRSVSGTPLETTGGTQAQYYGWGQWEYVTAGHSSSNITGNTVSLRGPTSYAEFNSYYGITGGSNPTFLKGGTYKDGTLQNNKKIPILSAAGGQEYLLVIQFNDSSFSTKGLLIRTQGFGSMTGGYNQLKPNLPTVVNISAYNGYASGMLRNLTEARSLLSVSQVGLDPSRPRDPTGTGTGITNYLSYPTSDSTNGGTITPGIV